MSKVTITFPNGKTKEYEKGITYYEISQELKKKKNPILGVKINNELSSLDTKIFQDAHVDFFDVQDLAGYKMYQGALKFIFEVAVKELFPQSEVHFLHSVPKGILSEIISNENFTNYEVNQIKERMAEIIGAKELFQKYNLFKKDAYQYFMQTKEPEKAKNIQNISNEIVTLYKLRNKINYFYTFLPYDTSAITKYELVYIGKNRIILVCPSIITGEVPDYVHYDNIIETFFERKKWLRLMETPYLSNLNDLISHNHIKEFMATNELIFNEEILKCVNEIVSKREVKFILIAGPSSSGKTTTTKRLATYLKAKGFEPVCLSTDDFFVEREETPKNEKGEFDFECLQAIDLELFNKTLKNLLKGEKVEIPEYNFVSGKKEFNHHYLELKKNSIVLIEGLHCLNDELVPYIKDENKYKIYLSPFISLNIDRHNYISTLDMRLIRRIVRDNRTRGKSVDKTIQEWQVVRRGEEKYIFPYIHQADTIINTALAYELGVLKIYAEPLLYSVAMHSPYYEEARRLINALKGFYPISSEYVKDDSILREFIG
ncbi:MAG: nucleoside kinase [Bacilli bacterium]|nr:nucleoside kinase [Bacilli bacterium]